MSIPLLPTRQEHLLVPILDMIMAIAKRPSFIGNIDIYVNWRPNAPDVIKIEIEVRENGILANTHVLDHSGRKGVAAALHEAVRAGANSLKHNDYDGIVLVPKSTPGSAYLDGAWPPPPPIGHFSGVLEFGLKVMTPSMMTQWGEMARECYIRGDALTNKERAMVEKRPFSTLTYARALEVTRPIPSISEGERFLTFCVRPVLL